KGVGYDALGDRHDADTVGEFIDDPDFLVVPRINGDWFEADRDFGEQARMGRLGNVEYRQTRVRGVDREKAGAIGREADRAGLLAFEVYIRPLAEGRGGAEQQHEEFWCEARRR